MTIDDVFQMMFTMRSHHMLTDVVLEVGNELFHVHKVVLAAGSPYFKVSTFLILIFIHFELYSIRKLRHSLTTIHKGRNYRTPPATVLTNSSRLLHTSDHTRTPVVRSMYVLLGRPVTHIQYILKYTKQ